jgi:hypothetical protein
MKATEKISVSKNILTLASIIVLIAGATGSVSVFLEQNAQAQTNSTAGQNQTNMIMGAANITGSIPLGQTIAKAISSQVHVSLANASLIAEKAVGAGAHAASVRLGIVQGSLVYTAWVVDNNYNFHHVLVDPGNGKVLALSQIPKQHLLMNGRMGMGMKAHVIGPHGLGIVVQHRGVIMRPGMMARP